MSETMDTLRDRAAEWAGKAGEMADQAQEQAVQVVEQAKEMATDLADKYGDKVADAVHQATDFVDDKTGGRLHTVTAKVEELTDQAVDALQSEKPAAEPAAEATDAPAAEA